LRAKVNDDKPKQVKKIINKAYLHRQGLQGKVQEFVILQLDPKLCSFT
jgi:hypothetical protein